VNEKSQIQALDRTQPGLPLKNGRCGTYTHDYKRHGTTTLFAALQVAEGKVIGECYPRHRHHEFLKYLRRLNSEFPSKVDEDQIKAVGSVFSKGPLRQGHSRLSAYYARETGDSNIAKRAWVEFFVDPDGLQLMGSGVTPYSLCGPDVLNDREEVLLTTNNVAQWALAAIQNIALVGDNLVQHSLVEPL